MKGAAMAAEKTSNNESDVRAIREWINHYCACVTSGDFQGYRAFWTDDVVWLPPGGPTVEGIEACMAHNRPYFEDYDSVETMTADEIEIADRFAYVRVSYTCRGKPKKGGPPIDEDGKGLFILRRRTDGSWVSTHCVWNSNRPAA
jgi:ketosteroid isomerase-like protein